MRADEWIPEDQEAVESGGMRVEEAWVYLTPYPVSTAYAATLALERGCLVGNCCLIRLPGRYESVTPSPARGGGRGRDHHPSSRNIPGPWIR
jgi:hypothetical protein